jgi:hypothetical protein
MCNYIDRAFATVCTTKQVGAWKSECGDGIVDPTLETCECTVLVDGQRFALLEDAIECHACWMEVGIQTSMRVNNRMSFRCLYRIVLTIRHHKLCRYAEGADKSTSCDWCSNCQLQPGKECTALHVDSAAVQCCGTDGMHKAFGTRCAGLYGYGGYCAAGSCISTICEAFAGTVLVSQQGVAQLALRVMHAVASRAPLPCVWLSDTPLGGSLSHRSAR